MNAGQELLASVSSDHYINVSICTLVDYQKWLRTDDLIEYEGREDEGLLGLGVRNDCRNKRSKNSDGSVAVSIDAWLGRSPRIRLPNFGAFYFSSWP
jgi:hypothetical protein